MASFYSNKTNIVSAFDSDSRSNDEDDYGTFQHSQSSSHSTTAVAEVSKEVNSTTEVLSTPDSAASVLKRKNTVNSGMLATHTKARTQVNSLAMEDFNSQLDDRSTQHQLPTPWSTPGGPSGFASLLNSQQFDQPQIPTPDTFGKYGFEYSMGNTPTFGVNAGNNSKSTNHGGGNTGPLDMLYGYTHGFPQHVPVYNDFTEEQLAVDDNAQEHNGIKMEDNLEDDPFMSPPPSYNGEHEESDLEDRRPYKAPKINKDGMPRKPRQPRAKLLKWSDNDWKNVVLGIIWACGECGLQIPFEQASQVVGERCTAGALQQAVLKLRMKQVEEGNKIPALKMAWTRKSRTPGSSVSDANLNDVQIPSKTKTVLPRKKPTRFVGNQSHIATLKKAYDDDARSFLPFPYKFPKVAPRLPSILPHDLVVFNANANLPSPSSADFRFGENTPQRNVLARVSQLGRPPHLQGRQGHLHQRSLAQDSSPSERTEIRFRMGSLGSPRDHAAPSYLPQTPPSPSWYTPTPSSSYGYFARSSYGADDPSSLTSATPPLYAAATPSLYSTTVPFMHAIDAPSQGESNIGASADLDDDVFGNVADNLGLPTSADSSGYYSAVDSRTNIDYMGLSRAGTFVSRNRPGWAHTATTQPANQVIDNETSTSCPTWRPATPPNPQARQRIENGLHSGSHNPQGPTAWSAFPDMADGSVLSNSVFSPPFECVPTSDVFMDDVKNA